MGKRPPSLKLWRARRSLERRRVVGQSSTEEEKASANRVGDAHCPEGPTFVEARVFSPPSGTPHRWLGTGRRPDRGDSFRGSETNRT